LRPGDAYVGCELRPDDHARLASLLTGVAPQGVRAEAKLADGYAEAEARGRGRRLLVIDPPFERGDDYARTVQALAARGGGPALVWLPLKDLDTFDRFLIDLEAARVGAVQVSEVRLRPLDQPLKMNGCAVVLVDAPDLSGLSDAVGGWIARSLGDDGAAARTWTL